MDPMGMNNGDFNQRFFSGWWFEPNPSEKYTISSIGMVWVIWEKKTWQPNHQPGMFENMKTAFFFEEF